ncbi:hypothetical protein [Planococcus sp. CAU13]|uniref:hypothetical protein n=1 Tax=Planococcus sp. CAU13 TaxID=1541197 RepID=UPI00052FF105|nr:hypothetical protein [Planococcus sp. CAU13]
MAMKKQSSAISIIKIFSYGALLLSSLYFISYLNIFPEAVSYHEEQQTIEIKQGALEKTSYTFDKSELELNDQLRLAILRDDISILQSLLVLIAVIIPLGFIVAIEQRNIELFKFSKILKTLSFLLVLLAVSILLIVGYTQKVKDINENLSPLISGET